MIETNENILSLSKEIQDTIEEPKYMTQKAFTTERIKSTNLQL